ncbi:response regulator transcription factor [Salinisphaera sp. Q1T1-3]|uniref:response regulator n=1 Tax=Salinisphaera sp. Q1T1-3 TaxID=2321229 RepID=UPI001F1D1648|nr:response regulator transcription factor [Salinisphaera sp. Q1T1-3]
MAATPNADSMRKVIIADDHPLFRTALSQAVTQALGQPDLVALGSVEELNAWLAESGSEADLLLLDLNMPGARGYSSLVHAKSVVPTLPVIVVSAHEDASVAQASVEHGASGFIPKSASPEVMAQAIDEVLAGRTWLPEGTEDAQAAKDDFTEKLATLTPQQQRVLMMLTDGLLNKQIAIDLDISEATVKAHITAILRKLDVHTRTQAVIAARSLEIDWQSYARKELGSGS